MAFKERNEGETISVKVVDTDGSFEYLKVTLEEFIEMSCDFYKPKSYYKDGKGYPFPSDESEWDCLKGCFVLLEV